MEVRLTIKGDLEVTEDGSESHPIWERASLRLFLSLSNVVKNKVGKVKELELKNALYQENVKI